MKLFCNLDKKTIIITESQRRKIQEMIAYHGSKMNFDEFNLAYMGTGVGAQEFGEGIYLTFDKEAAYGYGGTIYTVNIPDENKANYIYYDRPIPSDLFSAIIDNIVADITRQYPDEYTDEQSIEDLKKELYDIMDPSEGRHLMYNIHRYIDDSIVIPKILKSAGVTGFIYNNGKVNNVIMFSSRDIKILDKETVNENKNHIEEEYFTPNELLTETKTYYANMDKNLIIKDGRTAVKTTPSQLEDKLKEIWDANEKEEFKLKSAIHRLMAWPKNKKGLEQYEKDISKIKFDCENFEAIGDVRTNNKGISYVIVRAGGDWEFPLLVFIYFDGKHIRGYIPTYGNCFDRYKKIAFGNGDDLDYEFIRNEFKDEKASPYDIKKHLKYNMDACVEDFNKHIKVNGKYEGKKSNVSESIHNNNDLINESYLIEAELKDIYPKYYNDIPQDIFWNIIKTDPTYDEQRSQKMGKYGKWLLNQYRQGNLDMNNLPKVRNTIDFFNRYNRQLEVKDINQYKNIDQVYDNVKNFMEDPSQATSKSDEVRKIKEMGAEKVYEDNDWLIIVPKTREAAIYYGKGTKWCTASTDSYNYFERYNNEGRLYININKNTGDKYQFHFESNSFMDAEDKPIKGIIAEEIGLSSGAEQFYASLGEDQEYAISSEEHTDPDEEPEEEEILNQNGWQMIYNNNTGEITIHSDNENYEISYDGEIQQQNGYSIVEPLYKFLPVFVIEKLQEYYNDETFYKMVLADYDSTDKGYDYYPIGNNDAVFKYYDDINSGVLYKVDEQTYQFAKIIDFISFDLKLKDKISRASIDNLILLNEYDEQLCYNVNTFTWAFDEPVDKFCFTNAVKATALKNGQGFVKIFKNNTVIQVPSYNNMPINTLDYDDNANAVIIEVLNNGEKAYAVYSVAKNQYVNTKLYASACYMRTKNAIAMVSDKSERMTDSSLNLTKQGSDYMMDLFYKYGYIIYYNPNSSDQIIFANGKSMTRKDYFKFEEIYDFLAKVRQQPKLTYLKK